MPRNSAHCSGVISNALGGSLKGCSCLCSIGTAISFSPFDLLLQVATLVLFNHYCIVRHLIITAASLFPSFTCRPSDERHQFGSPSMISKGAETKSFDLRQISARWLECSCKAAVRSNEKFV